ncbi:MULTISPECIES: LPXTG cell wall anchor domain-containing protein [unclassified Enterococcus]|uniref:LPXTG cell wall anchor domain-containing protein n=1 Tax=unclassified Enterococcus TaxID=2608891 RepID=UPI001F156084|nr:MULTISPECIES: LPXTG cell wall anchor domain-containing protein [unclassified Enterococcus]
MKTLKKLMSGTLITGLLFGNIGGTVVEAASALRNIEVPALRQLEKKQIKQKEAKENLEGTTKEKKEDRVSPFVSAQTTPLTMDGRMEKIQETTSVSDDHSSTFGLVRSTVVDHSRSESNRAEIQSAVGNKIEWAIGRAVSSTSATQFKDTTITFNRITARGWDFGSDRGFAPDVGEFVQDNLLFLYSDRRGIGSGLWSTTTDSICGNWRLTVYASREADDSADHIFARITRLKWGSLNTTSVNFNLPIIVSYGEWFNSPPYFRDVTLDGSTRPISINIPGIIQSHGQITATAKTGPHTLTQNETELPDPSTYITTGNTIGRVTTGWKDGKAPDTSTVGRVNGEITVTDETGRTTNVTVPFTVQPAHLQVTPKDGTNEIYQYAALPSPEDYFEVTNLYGTHRLQWIDASTQESGTHTWQVKVTASDGREATSSTTMEVLPHPGISLKLKPIEDRKLAGDYDTLSHNFREYIEEATALGKSINVDDLEFVVSDSTEPDYSVVGKQKIKLTVQTKHPETGNIIKGTAETTVSIIWGDTFMLKSHDGQSAGAYAFQLRNGTTARITAVKGLDSPLDQRVGKEDSPYYSIEVLRNNERTYFHEVPGRATLQEVINTFGDTNGYLDVRLGDVIKIDHPQRTDGSSVLMVDEKEQDFTSGTNYAYYKVTAFGFEPIPVLPDTKVELKLKPMEDRKIGESYATMASSFKEYIEEATFEGSPVNVDDLEFIAEESTEPSNMIAGEQSVRITVQMKHPVSGERIKGSAETSVNYLWGDTFMIKSSTGGSAGAFSLQLRGGNSARLIASRGLISPLDERVGREDALHSVYYSIDVLRNNTSQYSYEVLGRGTLQQVLDNFGDGKGYQDVRLNDIIKVYHPRQAENHSIVMVDEQEQDFTYESDHAYYRVTSFGFEPIPIMEAEAATQELTLMQDISKLEPKEWIKDVTINHKSITDDRYTIEEITPIDVTKTGKRNAKLRIRMNDGLAETELEVPYEVKWGSTIVLKGLDNITAGAYSLLNQNDQLALYASPGIDGTDTNQPVNNPFGRGVYYAVEVLKTEENKPKTKYIHEVTGNMTIKQAVDRFNGGQPLPVDVGDTIKVYHAETGTKNVLMMDEMERDYTSGSNYAYYHVTEEGLEPVAELKADAIAQVMTLGQTTADIDPAALIENVTHNGRPLTTDLYKVEQLAAFDTTTIGQKSIRLKITTTDGIASTEVKVPYEVQWGSTIRIKNHEGATIGAFSLVNQNQRLEIRSSQALKDTELTKVVHDYLDRSVYYQFEVMNTNNTTSKFNYEVTGNRTIEQALARFNNGQPLNVNAGDIIRIYHAKDFNQNTLMEDEQERNFTYGSQYAYYEVTNYGFEPTGEFKAEANEVELTVGTKDINLKSFVKNVRVNGKPITENFYTVALDSEIDTSTVGSNTATVRVTANEEYGGFTQELNVPYNVLEEQINDASNGGGNNGTGASSSNETPETPSLTTDGPSSESGELTPSGPESGSSQNMPQTGEMRNAAFTAIGFLMAGAAGFILYKRRKTAAEEKTETGE